MCHQVPFGTIEDTLPRRFGALPHSSSCHDVLLKPRSRSESGKVSGSSQQFTRSTAATAASQYGTVESIAYMTVIQKLSKSLLKSSLFDLIPSYPTTSFPKKQLWQGALMIFFSNSFWKRALDSWHHLSRPKACIHLVWGKSGPDEPASLQGPSHCTAETYTKRNFPIWETDVHFAIWGLSSTHSANNFAIGLICQGWFSAHWTATMGKNKQPWVK